MRITKLVFVSISLVIGLCGIASADRLTELKEERTKIQTELQAVQDYGQKLQIRAIEINGIIKELTPKEVADYAVKQ